MKRARERILVEINLMWCQLPEPYSPQEHLHPKIPTVPLSAMKPLPPRQQTAPGTNLGLLKKAFEHEQFPICSPRADVIAIVIFGVTQLMLWWQFDFIKFQLG